MKVVWRSVSVVVALAYAMQAGHHVLRGETARCPIRQDIGVADPPQYSSLYRRRLSADSGRTSGLKRRVAADGFGPWWRLVGERGGKENAKDLGQECQR